MLIPLQVHRARKEERALAAASGEKYQIYKRSTWFLGEYAVPRLKGHACNSDFRYVASGLAHARGPEVAQAPRSRRPPGTILTTEKDYKMGQRSGQRSMKSKATAGLYVLLIIFAAISMVYYVAGVVALREEFFHASRYSDKPFDFHDDGQTLDGVRKRSAGRRSLPRRFRDRTQRGPVHRLCSGPRSCAAIQTRHTHPGHHAHTCRESA